MKKVVMMFVCVMALMLLPSYAEAKTKQRYVGDVKITNQFVGNKKVNTTLAWEKLDVDGIEIFRKKGSEEQKVAALSGDQTKYTMTLKYNKNNTFVIKTYVTSKGKKKYYDNKLISVYTGLEKPEWTERLSVYSKTSAKKIPLKMNKPSEVKNKVKYEIYRKTNGKYKKITTTKKAKYDDKKVNASKSYSYKFRYYIVVDGKKIYSKFSKVVNLSAINYNGTYKMECLTKPGTVDSIEVKITSADKNNGKGYIEAYEMDTDLVATNNNGNGEFFKIDRYSYDGKNWISCKEDQYDRNAKIQLNAQETVYLSFVKCDEDGKKTGAFDFDLNKYAKATFTVPMTYGKNYYRLELDFKSNAVKHFLNEAEYDE